jgi:hypothetical protein
MSGHSDPNKSYAAHATVMILFTLVLGFFAFWLVIHHRDVPDRVEMIHNDRSSEVVNCCAEE